MSADAFKAVTWNVEYTTPARELEPIVDRLIRDGVSIFLIQELTQFQVRHMLRNPGLHLAWVAPRYGIAWTDRWHVLERSNPRMSEAIYTRRGGAKVVTRAAMARLQDGHDGPILDALSYQLPSSVQRAHPLPGRLEVTREAMGTLRELKRASSTTGADGGLFGGDDNVDERLRHGPWGFMLEKATGLKLTRPPTPTHAGGRKLDDFRTWGLTVGHGWTNPGGGDHRLHGRVFKWK